MYLLSKNYISLNLILLLFQHIAMHLKWRIVDASQGGWARVELQMMRHIPDRLLIQIQSPVAERSHALQSDSVKSTQARIKRSSSYQQNMLKLQNNTLAQKIYNCLMKFEEKKIEHDIFHLFCFVSSSILD